MNSTTTLVDGLVAMMYEADRRATACGKTQFVVMSPVGPCVVGQGETTQANEQAAIYFVDPPPAP